MKNTSRKARILTAAALAGAFVVGGGVSSISASTGGKVSVTSRPPTLNTIRTKNGALPTSVPPSLTRRSTTSSSVSTMPRTKNGVVSKGKSKSGK